MMLTGLHRSALVSLVLLSLLAGGAHAARASAAPGSRVLYTANWHRGIHGWIKAGELNGDWTVKGGNLSVSAKSGSANSPSVLVAPIAMTAGRSYTVEARIRVMPHGLGSYPYFGVFAAASLQSDDVYGRNTRVDGIFGAVDDSSASLVSELAAPGLASPVAQPLNTAQTAFRAGSAWHLYRLSVHGSRFVFSVDGKTYDAAGAASYRNRPRLGLFAGQVAIEIQSFRVLTP